GGVPLSFSQALFGVFPEKLCEFRCRRFWAWLRAGTGGPGRAEEVFSAGALGGEGLGHLIGSAVAEHREQDIAAAAGQGDHGLVVLLALGALLVVVGPRDVVLAFQRRERREKQGALEDLVAL